MNIKKWLLMLPYQTKEQKEIFEHLTKEEKEEFKKNSKEEKHRRKRGMFFVAPIAVISAFVIRHTTFSFLYKISILGMMGVIIGSLSNKYLLKSYSPHIEKQLFLLNNSKYAKENKITV